MIDILSNRVSTNDSKGINEEKLDLLVVEIYDYADRIKLLLNEIDDLVVETKEFYQCTEGDEFRSKFDALKSFFPSVNKNIISYAEDLVSAKIKFINIDSDLSTRTKEAASKVLDSGIGKYEEQK